ncbi:uncharacterized protein LOC143024776 [Oratosquilla oratoria]|uniref:uncharacterized protein LOC143024776 n=1 Tax=Oratosquilla oratoria TaxID=337810 RepID=UPI003F762EEA
MNDQKAQKCEHQVSELNNNQELIIIPKKKKKKRKKDNFCNKFMLHKENAVVQECKDDFTTGNVEIGNDSYNLNSYNENRVSKKRKKQNNNCETDDTYVCKKKKIKGDCSAVGNKISNKKNISREQWEVDDEKISKKKKKKIDKNVEEKLSMTRKPKESDIGYKELTQKKKHKVVDVEYEMVSKKKKEQKNIKSSTKKKKKIEVNASTRMLSYAEKEDCLETFVTEPHEKKRASLVNIHEDRFNISNNISHRKIVEGKAETIKKLQYTNSCSGLDVRLPRVEVQLCDEAKLVRQNEVEKVKVLGNDENEISSQTSNFTNISHQRTAQGEPKDFDVGRDLSEEEPSSDSEEENLGEHNSRDGRHSYKVRNSEKGMIKSLNYGKGDKDEFSFLCQETDSEENCSFENEGEMDKILEVLGLTDEGSIDEDFQLVKRKDALHSLPSYHEATEKDVRGIRTHKSWLVCAVKGRSIIGLDIEAPFKGDRSSLKVPKEEEDYWKSLYSRISDNDYTEEEVNEEVERRLNNLVKKWNLVEKGILEGEERPPKDFSEPYIPKEGHIEVLKNLNIKIKRKISNLEERSWYFTWVNGLAASKHDKDLKKEGFSWKRKGFSRREDEILVENWKRFQKEYKFYDLRPLIGMRTIVVRKKEDEYVFYSIRYLTIKQTLDFMIYMLEDLPERTILQVYMRLHRVGQYLKNGKFQTKDEMIPKVTGRSLALLENLLRRFGSNFIAIETVLGWRERKVYYDWCTQYLVYRKTKFFTGPWRKDEELRLLKGIYSLAKPNNMNDLIHTTLPWKKIFEYVGTRTSLDCQLKWKGKLGQLLTTKERTVGEKAEWPKLTDEEKLKLIELVYESEADIQARVDWKGLCKDHFPRFFPNHLATSFSNFYVSRVPNKKRYYFDDGIEYLYKYVRPLLQKKTKRNNERLVDVSEVIRNLPLPQESCQILRDRYTDSHDVDEDEDIIDDPSL